MADRLGIYNTALIYIGESPLSALTNDQPLRYALDTVWDRVTRDALSRGFWEFAIRSTTLSSTTATTYAGYSRAFAQPSDWLQTVRLTASGDSIPGIEAVNQSAQQVAIEANGMFYSNSTTIALEYLSSNALTNANVENWTPLFTGYVATQLALEIAFSATNKLQLIEPLKDAATMRLQDALDREARPALEVQAPLLSGQTGPRLNIYNQALQLVGQPRLSSLGDVMPIRFALDDAWDNTVSDALSRGFWEFAIKSADLTADTTLASHEGYSNAFARPADWLQTVRLAVGNVSSDDVASAPEFTAIEANGRFYSNSDTIALEYISDAYIEPDTIEDWTPLFRSYVASLIAMEISPLAQVDAAGVEALEAMGQRRLEKALDREARPALEVQAPLLSGQTGPRLNIYNQALQLVGQPRLSSLGDVMPIRFALDDAWDNTVSDALSRGFWEFAIKSADLTADTTLASHEGYSNAFARPADWLQTVRLAVGNVSSDDVASAPEFTAIEANGRFYSNSDTIALEYISDAYIEPDTIEDWTPLFRSYVASLIAMEISPLAQVDAAGVEALEAMGQRRLEKALDREARPALEVQAPLLSGQTGPRLNIYNQALQLVGQPRLSSLGDVMPIRFALDDAWDNTVSDALSRGFWEFAIKSADLTADTTLASHEGYSNAFARPADWLQTVRLAVGNVSSDDVASAPEFTAIEANGRFYSNSDTIALEYISDAYIEPDTIEDWTPLFRSYVASLIAMEISPLAQVDAAGVEALEAMGQRRLEKALDREARPALEVQAPLLSGQTGPRLNIYNQALQLVGQPRLSSLGDVMPIRFALDDAWDNTVSDALSRGFWEFATKELQLDVDDVSCGVKGASTDADGFTTYPKPDDWMHTTYLSYSSRAEVYSQGGFTSGWGDQLSTIEDLGTAWRSDRSPIFVGYVSKDYLAETHIPSWSSLFTEFVISSLARRVAYYIQAPATTIDMLDRMDKDRILRARSQNALNQRQTPVSRGTWLRSRQGMWGPYINNGEGRGELDLTFSGLSGDPLPWLR